METQTIGATAATTVIERKLLQTVGNLHPQRAVQVLDFARWLETQPDLNEATEAELTLEQLAAEESVIRVRASAPCSGASGLPREGKRLPTNLRACLPSTETSLFLNTKYFCAIGWLQPAF